MPSPAFRRAKARTYTELPPYGGRNSEDSVPYPVFFLAVVGNAVPGIPAGESPNKFYPFSFFHSFTASSSQRLFLGLLAWPLTQW